MRRCASWSSATGAPATNWPDLRRAFSGIVAGNVKDEGVRAIREGGPFDIDGDRDIMQALDALLQAFVVQHRMKLPGGTAYEPCYRVRAG